MAARNNTGDPEQVSKGLSEHVREVIEREIRQHGGRRFEAESSLADLDVRRTSILERDLLWRVRPVTLRQVSSFTRELSILLAAGVPLLAALRNLGGRVRHQKFRQVVYRVGLMVENGHPFWEALSQFPGVFSRLYVNTVKSGEISGRLDVVLAKVAGHLEKEGMLLRKLWSAMIYPTVVVVVAIAIILFLTTYTMPVFIDLFRDFNADMPLITQWVMTFAEWLPQYWYLAVISPLILVVLYQALNSTYPGRLLFDRAKISLPVVGGIVKKVTAARFARTFAILDDSGVPILECLQIIRQTVGNEIVALDVDKLRESIEGGQSLERAVNRTRAFPPLLLDMLVVGEQSGRLNSILPQIADVYEEEVDIVMASIGSIIEPALILTMGIFVAVVFSAFFLPYLNLLNSALLF